MRKIAIKIFCFLMNFLKIKTVTIHDHYYDYMTDNDDLDDIPTMIDVTYSERLGIIIKKKQRHGTVIYEDLRETQRFYKAIGVNEWGGLNEYKKFTIYGENL